METDAYALKAGDRYLYRRTVVTITGEQEPHRDRFGRNQIRYMARRQDTGAEGYVIFGPGGTVSLLSDTDTR